VDDLLFTRDDIVANLTAVADLLDEEGSSQKALIVVGGSFLALLNRCAGLSTLSPAERGSGRTG
jgi:hypothetical protein